MYLVFSLRIVWNSLFLLLKFNLDFQNTIWWWRWQKNLVGFEIMIDDDDCICCWIWWFWTLCSNESVVELGDLEHSLVMSLVVEFWWSCKLSGDEAGVNDGDLEERCSVDESGAKSNVESGNFENSGVESGNLEALCSDESDSNLLSRQTVSRDAKCKRVVQECKQRQQQRVRWTRALREIISNGM